MRAALYWANAQAHAAFDTWRAVVAYEIRQLKKTSMNKVRGHWMNRHMSAAVNTWREHTELQMEMMERLYKAMFRWAHTKLTAAFNTWLAKVQGERTHEMLL